jgi:flagellar biosynthesis protein FliR
MILVFASFIFCGEQAIMQMGLGFAAAVGRDGHRQRGPGRR